MDTLPKKRCTDNKKMYMEGVPTLAVIKEIQIKTTVRYTLTKMAKNVG
jgi:hypothetical protein